MSRGDLTKEERERLRSVGTRWGTVVRAMAEAAHDYVNTHSAEDLQRMHDLQNEFVEAKRAYFMGRPGSIRLVPKPKV